MPVKHWWYTVPLRLRSMLRGRKVERELDEELQFHLECKTAEGIAKGLSQKEARHAAMRAMGGLEQRKEEIRDMRRIHWLTDFLDDLRYAIRSLRRAPGLAAFVVVTLAIGIGMATACFSMVDALIFRPYPVPHPGAVLSLTGTSHDTRYDDFSYREYLDIRDKTKSYDGVVASSRLGSVGFSADRGATPRIKGGMLVSGNYFRVLGVEPRIGRGFRDDEDVVPGRDAVMVLGPDFWKNEFASDPGVIGRTVRLNGRDFTVVGVAPESFPGMQVLFQRPDFYMPIAMAGTFATNAQKRYFVDRDDRELNVRARLLAGTALAQARNELTGLARDFERDYPEVNRDRGAAVYTQFEIRTRADDLNWKFVSMGSLLALAVLLVACTNVAGLLLGRARTRTREIAIRLALGAGRFRLIRLLLTESLVLALLGGLGGIVAGYGGIKFLGTLTWPAELPTANPAQMDTRMLVFSLMLALASAFLCGLAPALQSTRADLVNGLKTADVDPSGRRRLWGRHALVVAQVAMSLMLLTASFFLFRGFHESLGGITGIAKDRLLMAKFDPRMVQYDAAQTREFYRLLVERARAVPGVLRAALTQNPPLSLARFDAVTFVPEGFEMPRDRESFTSMTDTVDEAYFETIGIPMMRGRAFRASDTADAPRVAVVNEQFATHYWPGGDAIGKRLWLDGRSGTPVEIVGVAQTSKYRQTVERPADFVYVPLAQRPLPRMVLLLRSAGDPLLLVGAVKDIVRALDPNMPMLETRSWEDLYRYAAVDGPGIAVKMIGAMGAVGLLLAVAGLYGVVAYTVSRRTREIGIRMAIGAAPSDVLRLVMGKGLVLVGIGAAVGLVMGFALERFMNAVMFNVSGVDVTVYLIVVPSMLLVTALAAYVPARRAARIAPTQALRCD
jgi:predicted permease